MRWKETQVQRPAGVVGKSARVILFLIFVGLALLTARESVDSFSDTWRFGYLANNHWWIHEHFNDFIRSAGTGLYLLTLLVVTATAAVSITAERETETWTGLIASPLTAEEILKAKRAGVYRRTWPLIAAILSIWTIGLISGAVHPYGFLASMLLLAPYLSAAAALGLFVSLHVRTTARAIGASLCLTSFLHCGYMLLCVPMSPETVVVAFGCSPFLIGVAPISPGDMRDLVSFHAPGSNFSSVGSFYTRGGEIIFTALLSILAYTVLAITLNILSAVGFDSAVDRPRRPIKRP